MELARGLASPREAAALACFLAKAMRALRLGGRSISLTLCGDRRMRSLNKRARGIDRTTDVLSFPAAPTPGSPLLGDLVICLPVARRRAAALRRSLAAELRLYAVHGLLHLLGHDHHTPRDTARMRRQELRLLGESGLIARSMHNA